jgi:hypothetical protein
MALDDTATDGAVKSLLEDRRKQDDEQDPGPGVFEQYEVASWQVGSSNKRAFPVRTITETGGNRVVKRERPFRDGAKCDDTGAKPRTWALQAIFDNSLSVAGSNSLGEPDIEDVNSGVALYPDVLNELIESFQLYHDTAGDLVVPTVGKVRARLQDYTRDERPDERDCALVRMTFIEDNEDSVDAASFTGPSVNASASQLAATMEFSSQSDMGWDENMMSLNEFMANLEGLANMPSNFAADIDQQVGQTIGAANRANRAFTRPGVPGRDIFLDPESSVTQRKLEESKEIAYEAKYNYKKQFNVVTLTFKNAQSLTSISAMLGQDLNVLIDLNTQLADPFYILPGEPVKVVSDEPGAG